METDRREVSGTAVAYSVLIVALIMLSLAINSNETKYVLLKDFMFVLAITLIPRAAGAVLGKLRRRLASYILQVAVFWMLAVYLVLSLVIAPQLDSSAQPFILPLLFLSESIILIIFGSRSLINGLLNYSAVAAVGIGKALLLLSFSVFLFTHVPYRPFSYFFAPLVLFYIFDSFTAYMTKSESEPVSNLGKYVIKSGDRFPSIAALIGGLLVAYEYPKPEYLNNVILLVITIVTELTVIAVVWRIYATTSEKIQKVSNEVFKKHRKSLTVFSDTSLDSVTDSVNEFRVTGKKEKLIIALTMILTAAGHTLDECNVVLRSLILYRLPDPLIYKKRSVKLRIEHEIAMRDGIIREIMNEMKHIGVGT